MEGNILCTPYCSRPISCCSECSCLPHLYSNLGIVIPEIFTIWTPDELSPLHTQPPLEGGQPGLCLHLGEPGEEKVFATLGRAWFNVLCPGAASAGVDGGGWGRTGACVEESGDSQAPGQEGAGLCLCLLIFLLVLHQNLVSSSSRGVMDWWIALHWGPTPIHQAFPSAGCWAQRSGRQAWSSGTYRPREEPWPINRWSPSMWPRF